MRLDLKLNGLVDPEHAAGRDLAELAAQSVRGGVTLVQLRDKAGDTRRMVEAARAVKAALAGSGVPLVINDRVDVCLAAGADGVHLGASDMDPRDARRLLGPDAIVGVTVKSEPDADAAPLEAADYAGVGGVFETASKDNPDAPVGLDGLSRIAARLRSRKAGFPITAIAGITLERIPGVIAAGADGVSVISAIYMQENAEAAARELHAAVDAALKERRAA